jgi:hypothetical protein
MGSVPSLVCIFTIINGSCPAVFCVYYQRCETSALQKVAKQAGGNCLNEVKRG